MMVHPGERHYGSSRFSKLQEQRMKYDDRGAQAAGVLERRLPGE